MADIYVLAVQQWLNQTYGNNANFNYTVTEDGQTGNQTVQGLIRALQIELSASVDGSFGPGTSSAFKTMFPNGLSESTYSETPTIQRITKILQGGFYCKGINPYAFDGVFNTSTTNAVKQLQTDAGLTNANGIVDAILFQALLNTDGFTLANGGDANIRDVQQRLNRKYYNTIGLIPTNGIYGRPTHMGIVKALQYEVGATIDGYFGIGTQNLCPVLQMYGNNNTNLVYILQYILYCSGFNPNGFDGAFGNGVKNAVTNFQNFVKLTADGICGQQTWASLMSSAGDTTRTVTACDTRFEITDNRAKLLVKNGYQIVGRYIVGGDFKELRENEPEVIFNNGLKFFPIFQENGTSEENYSYAKGKESALKANLAVLKHKLPKNCTVYFAVDFDCLDYQITNSIIPYFQALSENFNSNYKMGIYGTRNTCQRVCNSISRVTSSFVSDMSTGYSGNLGYFLPNNWNYDQIANITLHDEKYGELEIDKVVYNGIIPAVSQLDTEEVKDDVIKVFNNLLKLYNIALNYTNNDKTKSNLLVLQYLRKDSYGDKKVFGSGNPAGTIAANIEWETIAGTIDKEFCLVVELAYDKGMLDLDFSFDDSPTNPSVPHEITHWAATLNALLYRTSSEDWESLDDVMDQYAGWAGDTISFAENIKEMADSEGNNYDYEGWAIKSICTSDAKNFDATDYIDDIDAYNIYSIMTSQGYNLVEAFYTYYIVKSYGNDKCQCEQRATNFIENMGYSKFDNYCEVLISDGPGIEILKRLLANVDQKYIEAAMNAFELFIANERKDGR